MTTIHRRIECWPKFSFFAALIFTSIFCGRTFAAEPNTTISVRAFGALGNGKTDDTAAIQKAIDGAKTGQTVLFPEGKYLVTSVGLRSGVRYLGQKAVIKRPANQGKWVRTFDASKVGYLYSGDADSALLTIDGFTFDGNRAQQGAYDKYELEQAHQIMLSADPARKGRLKALVQNCHFRETVADGVSIYTNVDARVLNCSSFNSFRGGFVFTGGNSKVFVRNFSSDGTFSSRGIDIEIDGEGFEKSKRVELQMENVRLRDGYFDVGVSDGSKVVIRNVISRSGLNVSAPDSTLLIENSQLGIGRFSDQSNRIVFPGDTTFRNCQFTIASALAPDANQPPPGQAGRWAAIHLYWNITGTAFKNQKMKFENCKFDVGKEIPQADLTQAFAIEGFSEPGENNTLSLENCDIASAFDEGFNIHRASRVLCKNTRIGAKTPLVLEP